MASEKKPDSAVPTGSLRFNTKEMAKLLGVSTPTVTSWVDEGAPCVMRGSRGKAAEFDGPAFIAWYSERIRREAGHDATAESLNQREMVADVELKEFKLRQARGDYLQRDGVTYAIRSMHTTVCSLLRQIPRRFGHQVLNITEMPAAVSVLTGIVEQQLADLRMPEPWQAIADNAPAHFERLAQQELAAG